ncbi:MAG TPA: putative motility protein [Firmicutes bacterium]|nr:putative motility protein [Bacillota bacterium]
MDIARMSTQLSQINLQYQVSVAVLKMAMEGVTVQTGELIETLEETAKALELSVQPHLGQNVDVVV